MNSKTLLVIDDCVDQRALLETAASMGGMRSVLRIVQDGATGLRYLEGAGSLADRGEHPLPALVLLDLNMPGLHGLEVLSLIRKKSDLAWLPVVIFSSSEDPGEIREAYQLGADGYLVKPMDFDELVDLLTFLDGIVAEEAPDIAALQDLPKFRTYPHSQDLAGISVNGIPAGAAYSNGGFPLMPLPRRKLGAT